MKPMKFIVATILAITLFIPTSSQAAGFPDVSTSHWAYSSIEKLSNAKIINGYSNGMFGPNNQVSRAQAAKILANALKLPLDSTFKTSYQDVPSTHWAYKEIRALTEKGVFSNTTTFNPDAPLSRAQMAKLLVVAYQIKIDDHHQVTFRDVLQDNWKPFIITLAEVKISEGVSWNYFSPYAKVTRAQLSVFIDRAIIWDQKRDSGVIKYDSTNKVYVDSTLSINDTAIQTVHLVNLERAKAGLPALVADAPLSKIATVKAEDMVKNNYFDHISPTYGKPWDMAKQFGYSYSSFGENIAYGQKTPQEVVTAWMNSPGHKANILNKDYTNIGAGIKKDANGRIYWVHMFSKK
ncbi:S-layer homology domain-containing protein [Paenisporosarcina quisquiliarum]|uniref:S-layer homology domain-containing protein n=1 Tax=Paenisporosarcina quisquiliarum TaxID=365346 RepID=A0A9X3LEX7_9BACL|nr:S-layer homology domain-containing protein [Paenisporosarcina quisquiliarum]MCZ8536653.1 S-layer homology domain-containing protein [Paenisporosarcina quisquiliarum]